MTELTPDEEALYQKLFGPGAPKPVTRPHKHVVIRHGDELAIQREERPDRSEMDAVPLRARRAIIICNNVKGRASTLAVVIDGGCVFRINTPDGEGPLGTWLGQDFAVDCRCGMEHRIDGGRLRTAVSTLPPRRGGKTPTIDILHVERTML